MISLLLPLAMAAAVQDERPTPEVVGALSAWGGCIEREASDRASESAPVETIADAALTACADSEREARAAVVRQIGETRVAGAFGQVRSGQRSEAMTWVRLARGEMGPMIAMHRYGRCVGHNIALFISAGEPAASLADRLQTLCAADEQAALAELRRGDPSASAADLAQLRDSAIAEAIRTVNERRARP